MKKFYEMYNYQQWIELENNKMIKSSCTCPDFQFRRLKKEEDKTVQIGTCKHISRVKGKNGWD